MPKCMNKKEFFNYFLQKKLRITGTNFCALRAPIIWAPGAPITQKSEYGSGIHTISINPFSFGPQKEKEKDK